jgi:hypothetical protein
MVSGGGAAVYDVALKRREALMGHSGPLAIVKNFKVFSIAMFACIGGLLYGYNQGVFSGVLAMSNFKLRKSMLLTAKQTQKFNVVQIWASMMTTSTRTPRRRDG